MRVYILEAVSQGIALFLMMRSCRLVMMLQGARKAQYVQPSPITSQGIRASQTSAAHRILPLVSQGTLVTVSLRAQVIVRLLRTTGLVNRTTLGLAGLQGAGPMVMMHDRTCHLLWCCLAGSNTHIHTQNVHAHTHAPTHAHAHTQTITITAHHNVGQHRVFRDRDTKDAHVYTKP